MKFNIGKNKITQKMNMVDKVIHYCLYAIIFLFPLVFFPNTDTVLEFPKMLVFGFLVVVASVTWLIGTIINKKIIIKQSPFNIMILIFGLLYIITTIFSIDRFTSFVGNGLSHGSLLSVILGIVFYFLLVNTVRDVKEAWEFVRAFMFSGLLVLVFNLSQIFDVNIFSYDFANNNAFNLIANSVSIFVVYTVILLLVSFGFLVKSKKRIDRILGEVVIMLSIAVLFFLDKNLGWYLLIAGMFIWLIFLSMQSKKLKAVWMIIPTVILVIGVGFLFFSTTSITSVVPPQDIKLDSQTAWEIAKSGGMQTFLFGSGPETFLYDFTEFRPAEFNNSSLWQLRFDRSYNEILQLFTTTGFFVTILFIGLFVFMIWKIGKKVIEAKLPNDNWSYMATVSVALFALLISTFFHHFSSATYLLFWILLALSGTIISTKTKKFDFQKSAQANFIFSLIFALVLVGSVSFVYFGLRVLISDNNFAQAEKESLKGSNIEIINSFVAKSVEQAPWNSQYRMTLAEQYIITSSLESDSIRVTQYLSDAKSEIDKAISLVPKNAAVIEQGAEGYRLINNLNGPVSANDVFEKYIDAVTLDPNNAQLHYTVANIYYKSAQNLNQSEEISAEMAEEINSLLQVAKQYSQQAISLKDNYWEAELILAEVLHEQGETLLAADTLVRSVNKNPYNLGLREKLGVYLIELEELDTAKEQIQIILQLEPNHSNAHFWLAVIYELQGNIENAISELELVLEMNPENELIIQKLSDLRSE